MVTVPVEGYEETRADTDEAIAQFRDRDRAKGGEIERAPTGRSSTGSTELEQLRADIDANVAASRPQRSTNNGDFSQRRVRPLHGADRARSSTPPPASRWRSTTPSCARAPSWPTPAPARSRSLSQLASAVIRDVTNARRHGARHRRRDHRAPRRSSRPSSATPTRCATPPATTPTSRPSAFPAQLTDDVVTAVDTAIDERHRSTSTPLPRRPSTSRRTRATAAYQDAVADRDPRPQRRRCNDAAAARQRVVRWPWRSSCSARRSC